MFDRAETLLLYIYSYKYHTIGMQDKKPIDNILCIRIVSIEAYNFD